MIDVHDPENPVWQGGLKTGSKVNGIYVRNGLAYVAASDENELRAVDVKSASSPRMVGYYSPSDYGRQIGRSLWYFEDSLQFGRPSGGFDIASDHELFEWASSTRSQDYVPMRPPDFASAPSSANIPGGIYGLVADRRYIYAATRTVDQELSVFDRTLATTTAVAHYSLPIAPQALTCDLDKLYVLAHTAPVIYEASFDTQKN